MASHTRCLLGVLAGAFLAGLTASGTCSIAVSSDHGCCDDCLDCDGCHDCDDCDDCLDPASKDPTPPAFEALLIDEDGAVHRGWVAWPPPGAR